MTTRVKRGGNALVVGVRMSAAMAQSIEKALSAAGGDPSRVSLSVFFDRSGGGRFTVDGEAHGFRVEQGTRPTECYVDAVGNWAELREVGDVQRTAFVESELTESDRKRVKDSVSAAEEARKQRHSLMLEGPAAPDPKRGKGRARFSIVAAAAAATPQPLPIAAGLSHGRGRGKGKSVQLTTFVGSREGAIRRVGSGRTQLSETLRKTAAPKAEKAEESAPRPPRLTAAPIAHVVPLRPAIGAPVAAAAAPPEEKKRPRKEQVQPQRQQQQQRDLPPVSVLLGPVSSRAEYATMAKAFKQLHKRYEELSTSLKRSQKEFSDLADQLQRAGAGQPAEEIAEKVKALHEQRYSTLVAEKEELQQLHAALSQSKKRLTDFASSMQSRPTKKPTSIS